ncbi:DUF5666 domain-containing protein [Tomitella fengzijianii]|nr:DUF5666 domain-containing protein [Tomitella fengzijianii]
MDESDRSSRDDDAAAAAWSRPSPGGDGPSAGEPDVPSAGEPTRRIPVPPQDPAYGPGQGHPGDEAYRPQVDYPPQGDPYPPGPPYAPGYGHPQNTAGYPTAPVQPTAFGSPAYVEPGFTDAPQRKRRPIGGLGALVAAVCVLLIGLGGAYLVSVGLGSSDEEPAVPVGIAQQAPAAVPHGGGQGGGVTGQPPQGGQGGGGAQSPQAPFGSLGGGSSAGPGGTGEHGTSAALGVVASIDGSTFFVRTIDGSENQVDTDGHTYFATVRGMGGISKLAVGDLVFVGGENRPDGTIEADMVIGGAFPELGAGTN